MQNYCNSFNHFNNCPCEQSHIIFTKEIFIQEGLINDLPQLIVHYDFKNPVVVCDNNTLIVGGEKAAALLACKKVVLSDKNLHANETAVEFLQQNLTITDCLIAVGSGTIHDIVRYVAFKLNIDFISIPTAASVDGFISSVAAMTWYGVKTTMPARAPIAVYADLDIIKNAPFSLTAAGVGDIAGKYIALADWKIAHLLTGETICQTVIELEEKAIQQVAECTDGLINGDVSSYRKLIEALLLSGIAMQMVGNSRPASGAEHHISHFIEMKYETEKSHALHGEKVGAATVELASIYRSFISHPAKIMQAQIPTKSELYDVFGTLCEGILKENLLNSTLLVDPIIFNSKIDEIVNIITNIPEPSVLNSLLDNVQCPTSLSQLGISSDNLHEIFRYSPYVRSRLTFLRILADFNLLSNL